MFDQLAEAVFAGDLEKAEGVLDLMHATGDRSEAIRRAKRRARPEPNAAPQLTEPFALPQPGKSAAEVFVRGGNLAPQGRLRA